MSIRIEKVLKLPLNILQWSGVVPSLNANRSKHVTQLFQILSLLIIINGLLFSGFRLAIILAKGTRAPVQESGQGYQLLDVIVDALYLFMTLRGPAVLLVFFFPSKKCGHFFRHLNTVLRNIFSDKSRQPQPEKLWTRWAVVATACVALMLASWEATSFTLTYVQHVINETSNSRSFEIIHLEVRTWAGILWWLFSTTTTIFLS